MSDFATLQSSIEMPNFIGDSFPVIVSTIVAVLTIGLWLKHIATAGFRTFQSRSFRPGLYFSYWVDPKKNEVNASIVRIAKRFGKLFIRVLYAHNANHNYSISIKPFAKQDDIYIGEWRAKGNKSLYRGPVLFRYNSNSLIGKWLGPKSNHDINGGDFVIEYIHALDNEYLAYKSNRLLYWLTRIKMPAKNAIICDIIKKHEALPDEYCFTYRDIKLHIPRGSFCPELGKVSTPLLEYAKTCAVRGSNILDLGTGSGYYAIALAKYLGCNVTGVDIDTMEINAAKSNANNNNVGHKARFFTVSKENPFESFINGEKYDLIIANLPFSRTSQVWHKRSHRMASCFHGNRKLIETLIMGSAYHILPRGKLVFAYSNSGYIEYLDDLINVSPWTVRNKKLSSAHKDDTYYIYDLRLKPECTRGFAAIQTAEQTELSI